MRSGQRLRLGRDGLRGSGERRFQQKLPCASQSIRAMPRAANQLLRRRRNRAPDAARRRLSALLPGETLRPLANKKRELIIKKQNPALFLVVKAHSAINLRELHIKILPISCQKLRGFVENRRKIAYISPVLPIIILRSRESGMSNSRMNNYGPIVTVDENYLLPTRSRAIRSLYEALDAANTSRPTSGRNSKKSLSPNI